jgi:hypothetical protein
MGTRSRIGVMHGDKLKSVYCHWDGYLSNNGKILQNHYDSAKANHLVSLGNLSSLGTDIGEKHEFDCPYHFKTPEFLAWNEAKNGMCTFYGRDRGESGVDFTVDQSYDEFLSKDYDYEYYYIMNDGVWYVGVAYDVDGMVPGQLYVLAEQLAKLTEEV